ncbi:MAG: carbohydrate ABC transporter permease [Clostridia bacterium]|nr:carbohydrate ABC transporter permease [Clostridia bacterium]
MKTKITLPSIVSALLKLVLIVIFIFPFYWMVITGFKTYMETLKFPPSLWPEEFQWINLKTVWESGPYLKYLKNSLVVSFGTLALQFFVMVPAAYAFAKYNFRGRGVLFGIVMVAFMVPTQVTFISIYHMMSKAQLLRTLWPQILPHAANCFGIFLLRQAFMQVPDELLESARLDNANEMQVLTKIMLPMGKPTLISIMMLAFIGIWNNYFWPFIMSTSKEVYPLTIGIAALRDVEGDFAWHIIMAGNVILVMPIVLVYIIFHKRIVRAFAYSGIK